MFRSTFSILLFGGCVVMMAVLNPSFAQCPQGAIGATGAGCGCIAGCNLTSFGGPNCGGAGVAGNCTAGYIPLSVDIIVPDGCTFTVTATMANRPGCSASGADGSCTTCDRLKVDIPGGPKPVQIGGSNATITDSYTLSGPATIRVSGGANRADEIITYSTTYSGTFCNACGSILPVELLYFSAEQEGDYVALNWSTASEVNNDYFLVERSLNGIDFETLALVDGIGNSGFRSNYKFYDSSPPLARQVYYRLTQVDQDGTHTVKRQTAADLSFSLAQFSAGELVINLRAYEQEVQVVEIYSADGKQVMSHQLVNNFLTVPWSAAGLWLIHFPELAWTEKVVCP